MSNLNDFIIENGVLKKYIGPGGDVVIPEEITEIDCFGVYFSNAESITFPDSVTYIPNISPYTLKKVVFSERVTHCGYDIFRECLYLEYIESTGSQKVQSEKGPRVVCSDELLSVLWNGLRADWKCRICLFQMWRQGTTGEKMAPIVKTYCTKNKKALLDAIVEMDDAAAMSTLLTMGRKPALDVVDGYLEKAQGKQALTSILLDYKAKIFTKNEVAKIQEDQQEKALGLKELSVADWRKIYTFKLENGSAIISAYKGNEPDVTVPAKIGKHDVVLGEKIFAQNKNVERIEIMAPVDTIPPSCFEGCEKLTEVSFPQSVKSIGWSAFQSCHSLKTITVHDSLKEIQGWAFAFCSSLTNIKVPKGVESIGEAAFYFCSNLEHITIPESVKINIRAFESCEKLADSSGYVIVNGILFDSYNKEEEIHIPDGVTRISSGAFDRISTKQIVVPVGVTIIEKEAFACQNLEIIHIPSTVKTIRAKAFHYYGGIPRKLVIYAPLGSAAAKFAAKYSIPFVAE